ncbi:MAG: hypothetical protein VXV96_15840 [Bdellovibrionota bacterium]|nr:hypothetical protein [Bdellovibrionota bacterium]
MKKLLWALIFSMGTASASYTHLECFIGNGALVTADVVHTDKPAFYLENVIYTDSNGISARMSVFGDTVVTHGRYPEIHGLDFLVLINNDFDSPLINEIEKVVINQNAATDMVSFYTNKCFLK